MLAGLPETAAAIAIILSVIVRMIRSDAAWKLVEDGEATAETLAELTGLGERERLIEAFGPPRLEDGVFSVTTAEVRRARTGLGILMGDWRADGACALAAGLALTPVWPAFGESRWLGLVLTSAALWQVGGWIISARLGKPA